MKIKKPFVNPSILLTLAMILTIAMLPQSAWAYGTRNWLNTNAFHNEKISDNTYTWGYNYRSRGRHTTIGEDEDMTGWMHNGNVRHGGSSGNTHWKGRINRVKQY